MPDKLPFQRYRGRDGKIVFARQRSEAFTTTVGSGLIDQRKAGSQRAVDLRCITKGAAGDYEVIDDLSTGCRNAVARGFFEEWFTSEPE